jgi:hypothetical protein
MWGAVSALADALMVTLAEALWGPPPPPGGGLRITWRDDDGDPEVDRVVDQVNADPWALSELEPHVPDGQLQLVMVSSSATIFATNDNKVLKIFHNDLRSKVQCDIERGVYHDIGHLRHVPSVHTYYAQGAVRFLVMDYVGPDAMVLLLRGEVDAPMCRKAFVQLGRCLDQIHQLGRVHGDVKLENITHWRGLWYFIDFGFGFTRGRHKGSISGTFPNILPALGLGRGREVDRVHGDYFAFALTMLALAGWDFPDVCEDCEAEDERCLHCQQSHGDELPLAKIDVGRLYRRYVGPSTDRTVRALIAVVLSQMDLGADRLVWDKVARRCAFKGVNPWYREGATTVPPIEQAWATIRSLWVAHEGDVGDTTADRRQGEGAFQQQDPPGVH